MLLSTRSPGFTFVRCDTEGAQLFAALAKLGHRRSGVPDPCVTLFALGVETDS